MTLPNHETPHVVDDDTRPRPSPKRFMTEAVIGVIIGVCVLAALITGTAEIPFVYQGY